MVMYVPLQRAWTTRHFYFKTFIPNNPLQRPVHGELSKVHLFVLKTTAHGRKVEAEPLHTYSAAKILNELLFKIVQQI